MTDEMITPIEYVSGNYADNGEVVVWRRDTIVENIRWHKESEFIRVGYNALFVNSERWHLLPAHEKCLRVEAVAGADWRGQLHALVDSIPEEGVLEALVMMREYY